MLFFEGANVDKINNNMGFQSLVKTADPLLTV